jgi:segregation and condensation protein B
MSGESASAETPKGSPLSLSRLREAFAAMLGESRESRVEGREPEVSAGGFQKSQAACEISPRSVIEAMLFVGRPDNGAFSARTLAAAMRGVSPGEIDTAVAELSALYDSQQTAYVIEGTSSGYRLVLRREFQRLRDKFYGTVREARLSPAAMEVLSIVAYNQPVSAERINELRGGPNGAALSTLVRRKIVRIDRPSEHGAQPQYWTTERFLKLFGMESLEELPRSEEVGMG